MFCFARSIVATLIGASADANKAAGTTPIIAAAEAVWGAKFDKMLLALQNYI